MTTYSYKKDSLKVLREYFELPSGLFLEQLKGKPMA